MLKVWICEAEHFSAPGRRLSVHRSEIAANAEAAKLCNMMCDDADHDKFGEAPPTVNGSSWPLALKWLQDCYGAQACYVEVTAHEVCS